MNKITFGALIQCYPKNHTLTQAQENISSIIKKEFKKSNILDSLILNKDTDVFLRAQTNGEITLSLNKEIPEFKLSDKIIGSYTPVDTQGEKLILQINPSNITNRDSLRQEINQFITRCKLFSENPLNSLNTAIEKKTRNSIARHSTTFNDITEGELFNASKPIY